MIGTDFKQHDSMNPSCFVNSSGWCWWNGVEHIFFAHFVHLSTNWASFNHHSLPEYCYWACPQLSDLSVPILWWRLPVSNGHQDMKAAGEIWKNLPKKFSSTLSFKNLLFPLRRFTRTSICAAFCLNTTSFLLFWFKWFCVWISDCTHSRFLLYKTSFF